MTTRKGRPMDYLGKYPCAVCGQNVRVYEWLPACVLCGKCEISIRKQETMGQEKQK